MPINAIFARARQGVLAVTAFALLLPACVQAADVTPGTTPGTTPAAPVTAAPLPPLDAINQRNVFTPGYQAWPDRIPVPPPPPPPPPTPALTTDDIELYGIVLAGPVRQAIVKLGAKLRAQLPPASPAEAQRPYLRLNQGQQLGPYTIAEIQPNQVLITAQGLRQGVAFSKKTDRPSPSAPAPAQIQAATPAAASPPPAGTPPTAPAPGAAPATANIGAGAVPSGAQATTAAPPPPVTSAPAGNPAGVASLAEAIAAAQAAANNGNRPGFNPTANPQPFINPFMQR